MFEGAHAPASVGGTVQLDAARDAVLYGPVIAGHLVTATYPVTLEDHRRVCGETEGGGGAVTISEGCLSTNGLKVDWQWDMYFHVLFGWHRPNTTPYAILRTARYGKERVENIADPTPINDLTVGQSVHRMGMGGRTYRIMTSHFTVSQACKVVDSASHRSERP